MRFARLLSYVDNWTTLAKDVSSTMSVLDRVKWATDGLALLLNPEKTRAFATTAPLRSHLRTQHFAGCPLQVCNNTQDLGVSFTAVLQPTAVTLQQRFEKNEVKLQRLQSLRWPSHRKFHVLQRVIWPSMVYGGELASTSPTYLAKVRSRFSAVLWGQGQHRDHFLAPLFAGDFRYEPFLLIMAQRLRALRRAFAQQPGHMHRRWNIACEGPRTTGPLRYLFDMLAQLSWTPKLDLLVTDGFKTWHLGLEDLEVLCEAVFGAWFASIGRKIQHKQGMEQIMTVDPVFSNLLQRTCKQPRSALGNFTSGAVLSSKSKRHFLSEAASRCQLCGGEDSQRHRLLFCPGTQVARLDRDVPLLLQTPSLCVERMLFAKPGSIQAWDDYLHNLDLQDVAGYFTDFVHLFTDGSTYGNHGIARASWAVILAEPSKLETAVFESGQLPGRQCNFRAELYAATVAVQSALEGAAIYIDCKGVVQGFLRLLRDGWDDRYWRKQKNQGLWRHLWVHLRPKLHLHWEVRHIKSHRDYRIQSSDYDAWTAYGNQQADEAAKRVQHDVSHPAFFLNKAAQDAFLQASQVSAQISSLQVAVLEVAAGCSKHAQPAPVQLSSLGDTSPSLTARWDIQWPPPQIFEDTVLSPSFLFKLQGFLAAREWFQSAVCISMAEFYLMFVSHTNWVVPVNIGAWPCDTQPPAFRSTAPSAWVHESEYEPLSLHRPSFTKQLTIFMHSLKFLFQRLQIPWTLVRGKHLAWMQCSQDVLGIPALPSDLINLRKSFLQHLRGSTFAAFAKHRFDPPHPATPLSFSIPHPQSRWNCYFRSLKRQRRS